jgi:hypothetical protein
MTKTIIMQEGKSPSVQPTINQIEADLQRRIAGVQQPQTQKKIRLPPNMKPLQTARSFSRFQLNMDFSVPDYTSRTLANWLLAKPLKMTIITAVVLLIIFYVLSVSKFTYFSVKKIYFDGSRRLAISVSNCNIVFAKLNSTVPNLIEVRETFSRSWLQDDFKIRLLNNSNSIYMWRPKVPDACQITIGVDNLSALFNLRLTCLADCNLRTEVGSAFVMDTLRVKGGSPNFALRNITIERIEIIADRFVANPLNLRTRLSFIIGYSISIVHRTTLPGTPAVTIYTKKIGRGLADRPPGRTPGPRIQ